MSPAFKEDLRSWWQFLRQGLGQPPYGYPWVPGGALGARRARDLATALLFLAQLRTEPLRWWGHLLSAHLCLGFHCITALGAGKKGGREEHPEGSQASPGVASWVLRLGASPQPSSERALSGEMSLS